jgi:hypothetical protein
LSNDKQLNLGKKGGVTMKKKLQMVFAVAVFLALVQAREVFAVCVAGDVTAPAKVTDLKSRDVSATGTLYQLTMPLDASSLAEIDLRYRTVAPTLSAVNWNSTTTTQVTGEPYPSDSGVNQIAGLSGLSPNTTYSMAVKIKDACGKWSAISNVISFTTPDAPLVEEDELHFTWSASPEPVTGYKVYCGYESRKYLTSIDVGKITDAKIIVMERGRTYYFAATAYEGSDESDFSNEVVYTMP